MCIDSMLWGKNCTSYKGWNFGGFPKYLTNDLEYGDQPLLADRYYGVAGAGSQEFMKVCIDAAWKIGKVYGFLLSFHTVDFILSSHAAAKRMYKWCEKIWFRNSKGLWRKWRLYFDFGHILYLKFGNSTWSRSVGHFRFYILVAWERADYYAEIRSKWRRYNWLKFVALRKRISDVCSLTALQLVKPDMRSRDWRAINK